jgi:hypothetical protein
LLALLDTTNSAVNRLRLLFTRRNVFVTQALLSNFHHPDPPFKTLAEARPHFIKYLSMCVVTEDDGSVMPHDHTFELDESFVKDHLAGKWDSLDFHKHLLVRLHAHRSRSLAPKVVPKIQQRLTATTSATGKMAARLFSPALRLRVMMLCLASRSSSRRSSHTLRLRRGRRPHRARPEGD